MNKTLDLITIGRSSVYLYGSQIGGKLEDMRAARLIRRIYEIGIYPDWWKLEPMETDMAWQNACNELATHDPHCRGVVVLGLASGEETFGQRLRSAACHPLVKGFAVGRTIFGDAARKWLSGPVPDEEAVAIMVGKYSNLCADWDEARQGAGILDGEKQAK